MVVEIGARPEIPIKPFEVWFGASGGRRLPIEEAPDPRDPTKNRRVDYSGHIGIYRIEGAQIDTDLDDAPDTSTLDYLISKEAGGIVIVDEVVQYIEGSPYQPISHRDHGEFRFVETTAPGGEVKVSLKSLL